MSPQDAAAAVEYFEILEKLRALQNAAQAGLLSIEDEYEIQRLQDRADELDALARQRQCHRSEPPLPPPYW